MTAPVLDITQEQGLSPAQAAKFIPCYRAGKKTHPSTVVRMIQAGVRTPAGRRVKLRAVRLGSRWITSVEAIREFIAAQQGEPETVAAAAFRSPSGRRRASEEAAAELSRIGC